MDSGRKASTVVASMSALAVRDVPVAEPSHRYQSTSLWPASEDSSLAFGTRNAMQNDGSRDSLSMSPSRILESAEYIGPWSPNPSIPVSPFSSLSLSAPSMQTYASSLQPPGMIMSSMPTSNSTSTATYPQFAQSFPPYKYPLVNPQDQNSPCDTLYVKNLPIDTSEDELKSLFSQQRGYKRICFRTKQSHPMCFVEFENVAFATKALNELYGHPLRNSVNGGIRLFFSRRPLGVRTGQVAPSPVYRGEFTRIPTPRAGQSHLLTGISTSPEPPKTYPEPFSIPSSRSDQGYQQNQKQIYSDIRDTVPDSDGLLVPIRQLRRSPPHMEPSLLPHDTNAPRNLPGDQQPVNPQPSQGTNQPRCSSYQPQPNAVSVQQLEQSFWSSIFDDTVAKLSGHKYMGDHNRASSNTNHHVMSRSRRWQTGQQKIPENPSETQSALPADLLRKQRPKRTISRSKQPEDLTCGASSLDSKEILSENPCLQNPSGNASLDQMTPNADVSSPDSTSSGSSSLESSSQDTLSEDSEAMMASDEFLQNSFVCVKSRFIDKLMKEVHVLQWLLPNTRTCQSGSRSSSDSGSTVQWQSNLNQGEQLRGKRPVGQGGGNPPGDNGEDDGDGYRRRKRGNVLQGLDPEVPTLRFACPYFKRNPRHHKGRACRYPGFKGIHRMKEHLYRSHVLIYCNRCHFVFQGEDELHNHQRQIQPCTISTDPLPEGLSATQVARLKSKKKFGSEKTEEERWLAVYHFLFPDEPVMSVSPYCDDIVEPCDGNDLDDFEIFSRREFPRRVRQKLDSLCERLEIDERFRAELARIADQCREELFSDYQQQKTGSSMPANEQMPQSNHKSRPDIVINASLDSEPPLPEPHSIPPIPGVRDSSYSQRSRPDFESRNQDGSSLCSHIFSKRLRPQQSSSVSSASEDNLDCSNGQSCFSSNSNPYPSSSDSTSNLGSDGSILPEIGDVDHPMYISTFPKYPNISENLELDSGSDTHDLYNKYFTTEPYIPQFFSFGAEIGHIDP